MKFARDFTTVVKKKKLLVGHLAIMDTQSIQQAPDLTVE